ncbi:MAG: DUF3604 domain-containing protein [Gammaproteobacteria bacterium]
MRRLLNPLLVVLLLSACSAPEKEGKTTPETAQKAASEALTYPLETERNALRNAYFGDTHIHTRYSFDAYLMGTRATPDDAYAFAKGDMLQHPSGFEMKMKKPLDFLSVTDHAFYLGAMREAAEGSGPLSELELGRVARSIKDPADSRAAFAAALGYVVSSQDREVDILDDKEVARSAWQDIIESAERHNDPGNFTTFIGYEYTAGGPEFENLHRNVIFRGSRVPDLPYSRLESLNPEDLWAWMDKQREDGIESLAIPHNSNGSNGWMFQMTKFDGSPQDAAYAEQRMRNEPIVENSQVKGTSDTHPLLSPNDEWADYEIMPLRIASNLTSQAPGSYVRDAYLRGLELEEKEGFNPYRFGVIGASDTHNAAGSFEEDNYWSKTGITDIEPSQRGSVPIAAEQSEATEDDPLGAAPVTAPDGRVYANAAAQFWSASGLAGVWAESNTREDIYAAFRRKETFSTSGPHIKVRFFGSTKFDSSMLEASDAVAQAYEKGVTMGGDLSRSDEAPTFFAWAAQDPDTVALQRLQIIKGWRADGEAKEMVYDIACSDGGAVDPETHRCPDNGAGVDLSNCAATPGKGAPELRTLWQDPDFDPEQRAFYYVRVLENPKCRWSTWDAIRAGIEPRVDMEATIQDRAWSSPIWYHP